MKKYLFISLIWLALACLLIMEKSWKDSGLLVPDRIDLYNNEGVIDKNDLDFLYYTAPDIHFEISSNVKCSVNDDSRQANVLAVSSDYNTMNPIYLVRGAFQLDNAVLLRRDYANKLFNTDDIIGENFVLNGQLHYISGIFELPPLITGVSSEIPEIITSIDNPALSIEKIQLFQTSVSLPADKTIIESLINSDDSHKLNLDIRYRLFCQLRKILYLFIALLIILTLIKILNKDRLRRKELFEKTIKKYYLPKTLTVIIKDKALLYLIPGVGIFILVWVFGFIPYIPVEYTEIHSLRELFFRLVSFILGLSDDFYPVILLPHLYETGAFLVITLLFIPGFIGISLIKKFSLRDTLVIPVLNIIFSFLLILLEIAPVFDLRINLLLFFLIVVNSSENNIEFMG